MKRIIEIFSFGLILMIVYSCNSPRTSIPELTFLKGNSLLPQVAFTTTDSIKVMIEYWRESLPSKRQVSSISTGKDHSIVLFNLKPETNYHYQIMSADGERRSLSDPIDFTTGAIPNQVLQIRKDKIDTAVFDGYILIRRFFRSGADIIIDNEGDIVWYNLYDLPVRRPLTWTKNNTILSIYDSAYIVETDMKGNRILDLNLEKIGIPNKVHHEVLYDQAHENIITLTLDSAKYNLSKFGGKPDQYLRADGLLVLSRDGKIKMDWNVLDVANPMQAGMIDNLKESWGHANSIAIDKSGNYLISFRDFNQVWKVSPTDGRVIWKFGKGGDFKMTKEDEFIAQHSIHFNDRGELMMFDNGNFKTRPNSKVMAFQLDEDNMEAKTTINVTLPRELSSYRMCSAELLSEGKYLVCTTKKNATLAIVNDQGEILWKVVGDNASYRAHFIKSPFALN